MKESISKLFKVTALATMVGLSAPAFASVDGVVAIVDDGVILKSELDRGISAFTQQLQAQNQALPPQQLIRKQVLDQLILRQIQKNLVKRYGVQITENELNSALANAAKQAGFKSLEEFQQDLDKKAPQSFARLRATMADDIAVQRLTQQMVISRIRVSDQDVENFLKSPSGQSTLGSQFYVVHLRIAGNNAQAVAPQVKTAFTQSHNIDELNKNFATQGVIVQGSDLGWKQLSDIPAELAVRVSSLNAGQVSEVIQGQDGSLHLVKVLDRKSSLEKAIVPQYQTRHILIQPSTVVSPELAKYTIERLYQRAMNGEDFATLATTFSTDTGSARDGGSLGWVNLGTMVPEFEAVMKATPVGTVSQPFQSQFGWHILKVENTRQHDMSEEYQQNVARQILGDSQFDTALEDWIREIRSTAYIDIK